MKNWNKNIDQLNVIELTNSYLSNLDSDNVFFFESTYSEIVKDITIIVATILTIMGIKRTLILINCACYSLIVYVENANASLFAIINIIRPADILSKKL